MPAGAIVVGDIVRAVYKNSGKILHESEFLVLSTCNGRVNSVMNMEYYDKIEEEDWGSYSSIVYHRDNINWIFVRKNEDIKDTSNPHYKVIRKIKLLQLKRKENGYVF